MNGVIQRTQDPALRQKFIAMLDCPIIDSRNQCRHFSDYIIGSLIKNRIYEKYDMEAALAYVFEKLMMPTSEAGSPRQTLFGSFDPNKPYTLEGNPLVARFLSWLTFAVGNIKRGKIPRLSRTEYRPQGTVSIAQGRSQKGDAFTGVSPEQIAARPSSDADLDELIADITTLLRRKELAYPINLTGLFGAIMSGQNTEQQRARFGDRAARIGRQVIISTIQEFAQTTQNHLLLHLLDLFKDFNASKPMPARRSLAKPTRPQQAPGKDKDFASILAVIDKFERPVGTADLGKYRRRWLEYPPRDAASGFKNRLEEVLAKMVEEGVLKATRTAKGAYVYEAGPNADKYRVLASV